MVSIKAFIDCFIDRLLVHKVLIILIASLNWVNAYEVSSSTHFFNRFDDVFFEFYINKLLHDDFQLFRQFWIENVMIKVYPLFSHQGRVKATFRGISIMNSVIVCFWFLCLMIVE